MISVCVFRPDGREFYQAQWKDPVTGKKKTKSTGKATKREAERVAAVIEKDLNEGTFKHPSTILWSEFRSRYETEVLPGLAVKTQSKVDTVLNSVERYINPARLVSMDTEQISKWVKLMRVDKLSEPTIKNYLGQLRAALRWAYRQKMLHEIPQFQMPTRTNKARRRAVTGEEFERMLKAIPKVVGARATASWDFFLRGLWTSGLRLGEALALSWDDPATIRVNLSGRRPLFEIPPHAQKSGKATLLPMSPEFYSLLMEVNQLDRTGKVFNPLTIREKWKKRIAYDTVGPIVKEIGKAANVKTAEEQFATAHDLRRSFGVRWSKKVMPPVLQKLMRHASIQTTMDFYAVEDAVSTADTVWEAVANAFANTEESLKQAEENETPASQKTDRG